MTPFQVREDIVFSRDTLGTEVTLPRCGEKSMALALGFFRWKSLVYSRFAMGLKHPFLRKRGSVGL